MTAAAPSNQYALGHATGEIARLIEQASFFGDLTERFIRDAGVVRAMRVLDVGAAGLATSRFSPPSLWVLMVR